MSIPEYDVAILMPQTTDHERTAIRYAGLFDELAAHAVSACMAHGLASYNAETHTFPGVTNVRHDVIADAAASRVVRDLTMPKDPANADLYNDRYGPILVHHPALNYYLTDKSNIARALPQFHPETRVAAAADILDAVSAIPGERVVIKPVTGSRSKGVQLLPKTALSNSQFNSGNYLVQEYIDTSAGIPEFDIKGTHNVRILSIGSKVVGALARVNGSNKDMLQNDVYGSYVPADDLPDTMHAAADAVHTELRRLSGHGANIIAIDMMRGRGASGEQIDVICEVNRRPQRISRYDTVGKQAGQNLDEAGLLELARLWDREEAVLLAGQLG